MNDSEVKVLVGVSGTGKAVGWLAEFNQLTAAYKGESDRAAALLAVSFLDHQLGESLKQMFVLDEETLAKMFKGTGPLSTFSARIDLAHLLGRLSPDTRRDLHILREIRNYFAHHPAHTDFSASKAKDLCENLSVKIPTDLPPSTRDRYLLAVASCLLVIKFNVKSEKRPKIPEM